MPETVKGDIKRKMTGLKWLWLSGLVVFLDLWTKGLASQHLQMYIPVNVFPGFNLTLVHNPGAAFSFLSEAGGWQRWFFIVLTVAVSAFILASLYQVRSGRSLFAIALAMILGGALGNLWDRATLGYVIDFIDISISFLPWKIFNPWPTFNLADSAISIGMMLLIIEIAVKPDAGDAENSEGRQ